MEKVLLVATGGALGAVCRYGAVVFAARVMDPRFPWGTLIVNLAGCLLAGLMFGLADKTAIITPSARLFVTTGFLGALTTFSTFAVESSAAMGTGSTAMAAANIIANNAGGIALVFAGIWLARVM